MKVRSAGTNRREPKKVTKSGIATQLILKHQYLLDKLSLYFDLPILPPYTHTHLCDIILAGWLVVLAGWMWVLVGGQM